MGKLSISRGHQLGGAVAPSPRLALVPRPVPQAPAALAPQPVASVAPIPPASFEYQVVHDRLTALERLARLHKQGALSAEEFAAEKALILGLPADELLLSEPIPPGEVRLAPRGPSLLGRLFSWKFLPVGLAAGVALSFASQPRETIRFFDEALRLFGA